MLPGYSPPDSQIHNNQILNEKYEQGIKDHIEKCTTRALFHYNQGNYCSCWFKRSQISNMTLLSTGTSATTLLGVMTLSVMDMGLTAALFLFTGSVLSK